MIPKFKKPKPTKENQPKEKQTKQYPMYKKHMRSILTDSSAMKQLDLDKLSRDYVLAHEKLTILSREYVMEHGRDFDDDSIGWDSYGYRHCELCGDEEVPVNGLYYGETCDGGWWYGYYEDGLKIGKEAAFFTSGELVSYAGEGKYYTWNENGRIMKYTLSVGTFYERYEWYGSGQLKENSFYNKSIARRDTYYWYENGKIWKYSSRDSRGLPVKIIEYDETGNIIRRIEYK